MKSMFLKNKFTIRAYSRIQSLVSTFKSARAFPNSVNKVLYIEGPHTRINKTSNYFMQI